MNFSSAQASHHPCWPGVLNSKLKHASLTREVPAILEDDQTASSSEDEEEEEGEEEEPEEREDQTQQSEKTPQDRKVTESLLAILLFSSRGQHINFSKFFC